MARVKRALGWRHIADINCFCFSINAGNIGVLTCLLRLFGIAGDGMIINLSCNLWIVWMYWFVFGADFVIGKGIDGSSVSGIVVIGLLVFGFWFIVE